ncbi:unnamed protein product [Symbiodinium natans]|uniref:Uncharacterized protein n=1 Tax=Symbiodinium natans TaxID=878477 RepID=A0A812SPG0_9DINO|nr:unnamed protein product [Symbiodinium natans]
MPTRNSQKLRGVILDSLSIFSEKQRRFLRSDEWAPNKLFEAEDDDIATGVKSAEDDPKVSADEPKPEEAKADAEKDPEKDAAGGWTFTIRERPMPDPSTGKKRRKGAEDSEARFEAMAEKNEASQKKQEEDVDTSLALLERLNQQNQTPHVARERTRRERTPKKKRHLSRSRSISAASVTSSSHRGKKGRAKKRKGRSRSRDRGDRGDRAGGAGGGGGGGGMSFEEALRRRMQQRDSEMETSRMPVVDPGHAKKNWR